MDTQDLSQIVDVVVEISPLSAPRATFNTMLIVGSSTHITKAVRVQSYTSMAAMAADGFITTDPEYIAALLYFSQSPAPRKVYIGRRDLTAVETAAVAESDEGTGYSAGDILTVVQSGASGCTLRVLTLDAGSVETTEIVTTGIGYIAASGLATTVTPSGGTGAKVNITCGETPLEAITACRAANIEWYVGMVCGAVAADHKAIGAWVESAQPSSVYAYTSQDADALAGTADNVFDYLRDRTYKRSIGQYTNPATGSPYAIAAIMGYAMGQNLGTANSAFTLKFKQEVGIAAEAISTSQISNIENANGNVYLNYGNYYNIFEQGVMPDGQFFDEILNLDMLVNNIQLSVMDLLYGNPKIPQTDPGVTQLIHAINLACENAVLIGFLAPGTWTGNAILNLANGDVLPKGYMVQAYPISAQLKADREARKSPPIYVAIKEAGAIHSVLIEVRVDR